MASHRAWSHAAALQPVEQPQRSAEDVLPAPAAAPAPAAVAENKQDSEDEHEPETTAAQRLRNAAHKARNSFEILGEDYEDDVADVEAKLDDEMLTRQEREADAAQAKQITLPQRKRRVTRLMLHRLAGHIGGAMISFLSLSAGPRGCSMLRAWTPTWSSRRWPRIRRSRRAGRACSPR
jgi:hypothetical protein